MAKIRPFWAILVRNSETKTLKIDPKVPNRPSRKGLQTGHWRNSGSYRKKTDFRAKIRPGGRKTARPAAERPLKIDPKVPNWRYCQELQTGHRQNPGSYSKKRIFGPKSENFGQKKKNSLLTPNHVPATTGQCCPKEKVPFYQIINGE